MKPIAPNDLVVVYKPTPCCNNTETIGNIFEVAEIKHLEGRCSFCGTDANGVSALSPGDANGGFWIQLFRLKKIDPLTIDDLVEEEEVFYEH
jgi:hypothetical protein